MTSRCSLGLEEQTTSNQLSEILMQATEQLVRSVVEEVLTQLRSSPGAGSLAAPRRNSGGQRGVFADVNEAITSARAAFEQLSERTIEDRKRIIDHVRRISIDQ